METVALARSQENTDTVTLRVQSTFSVTPGQFIMLGALIGEAGREIKRSYSVAGQGSGWLEITVRAQPQGVFSNYLCACKVGDALNLYGPFGRHFIWKPEEHDVEVPVAFIAGGTGIAPFRAMMQAAEDSKFAARGGRGHVIFSTRSSADIIYSSELPAWSEAGFPVTVTLTRPTEADTANWTGAFGRINARLLSAKLGSDLNAAKFYVCGPTPLVADVQTVLATLGVTPERIFVEKYGLIEG